MTVRCMTERLSEENIKELEHHVLLGFVFSILTMLNVLIQFYVLQTIISLKFSLL